MAHESDLEQIGRMFSTGITQGRDTIRGTLAPISEMSLYSRQRRRRFSPEEEVEITDLQEQIAKNTDLRRGIELFRRLEALMAESK